MKYYKITLRQKPGSTELIYPERYQEEIGNYNAGHLYYDEGDTPMLLMCIRDKDANNIVREYVEEITEKEAKAISEAKERRIERITDEAKIRRLELKVARGKTLTAEEEKALNPNDPTPGFEKNKILADRIDEMKTIERKLSRRKLLRRK